MPSSATIRAFNNSTLAFVNKFDRFTCTANAGNMINADNTSLSLTRNGNGNVYALRSRDFSPVPTTAIVRFTLQGSSNTSTATDAFALLLGSSFGDDATTSNAAASLKLNFKNSSTLSFSTDGGFTSGDYTAPDQEFWWVINKSGATQTYSGPDGKNYSISHLRVDLWYNNVRLVNDRAIANTATTLGEIKCVFIAGSGTVKLNNLRINPITQLTVPANCWYAGSPFDVNVTINTAGPGGAFNAGTIFSVQRSDKNGVFNADLTKDIYGTLTPGNPNSSTTLTISTTFPNTYTTGGTQDLGNLYRYRVISSDLPAVSEQNNSSMYYIINPGPESLEPKFPTLATVTASNTYTTSYWGYRYTSNGSTLVPIAGTTNKSTYVPNLNDYPGPGEYYLVAVSSSGCISNEKKISVNCSGNGNLIKNGTFDNVGSTKLNDLNNNGILEYDQGDFFTEYEQQLPTTTSQIPQGYYTIGTNPNNYNGAFCKMTKRSEWAPTTDINGNAISGGNMLITDANPNGSKILWQQKIVNLKKNTNYVFTFWGTSIDQAHFNTLQFGVYVDCYRLGDDISDNFSNACNWTKYSVQVNTGNLTELTLGIGNVSVARSGNDVAIDNIEFYECDDNNVVFSPVSKFEWKGYTSDWFKSDNWGVCAPNLPTCGDDVLIPANLPAGRVYPVIAARYPDRTPDSYDVYKGDNINGYNTTTGIDIRNTDPQVQTLTIEPGAKLTISATRNLRVCGNVINNGQIIASSTEALVFYGNSVQKIAGTGTFTNITVDQGAKVGFTAQVIQAADNASQAADITVNGLLDLRKSTDVLVINGKALTLNGTVSANPGTITGSPASRMEIGGTGDVGGSLKFTTGTTARQLASLVMNRTVNGQVTLGTPLTLVGGANALTLTSGLINTTVSNLLTLSINSTVTGSSSHVSGGSNSSHINGPMAKATNSTAVFTFPVGNVGYLGEVGIEPRDNTANTFTASYLRQNPYSFGSVLAPTFHHITKLEYWNLDRVGSSDAKISLHWTGYSDVGVDINAWKELRVAHYNSTTPIWENKGPGAGLGTNTVVQAGVSYTKGYLTSDWVNNFSPFTFGTNIINNPLPVTLISFTASLQQGKTELTWVTELEENSAYFNIQRSTDGKTYQTIGQVRAGTNSRTVQTYRFTDAAPVAGVNYYRLEPVDKDGRREYSKVEKVELIPAGTYLSLVPNPSNGADLWLHTNYSGAVQVTIYSITGQRLQSIALTAGQRQVTLTNPLPAGMYLVTLTTTHQLFQQKIYVR
jgi:hypothetical protein